MSYTGNREIYIEILNYLIDEGFNLSEKDVVHTGEDTYEFEESENLLGCHPIRKILAWKEGAEIKYKSKQTGWYCLD